MTGPGDPGGPELHQQLAGLAQLVDGVAGGVDHPDVAVRIDPDGVRAARVAARRAVDGGVAGRARRPVLRRHAGDLAVAEQPFAPRPHEGAVRREHQDRLRAAVQHQDVAVRPGGDRDHLAEVPGRGRAGGRRGRERPLGNLGVGGDRRLGRCRRRRHEADDSERQGESANGALPHG